MNENYYSMAFKNSSNLKSGMVYEYVEKDFKKVIDTLFLIVDLANERPIFRKPMHFIIAETANEIIIGINFDKAIYTNTTLVTMLSHDVNDEDLLRAAFDDEGLKLNLILHLPKKEFDSSFPKLLDIFNDNSTLKKRVNVIDSADIDNDVIVCVEAIKKSDTSNYGGDGMWVNPIFKARELVVDRNMCFCVLPFNTKRLELFDEVIKPNLEDKFGLTVIRSGKVIAPNLDIRENIWTYINKASFVIADLSDYNANVYYELDICHTLGKKVITLCDEESFEKDYENKLPFDISTINTIFYKNSVAGPTKLLAEINKNVTAIMQNEPYIEN